MNPRPELIFVHGPQEGERAVLMTNSVLIGRAPNADIRLTESAASREQLRFLLALEGWIMENLSANGTLVNGKRFKKSKKRLLLETGDILGAGVETEILYVAPGDDPEAALAAYRQSRPAPAAAPPVLAPAAPPAGAAEHPAGKTDAGSPAVHLPPPGVQEPKVKVQPPEEQAAAEEGEELEQPKGKKLKLILFGVVLVGMVCFGLALVYRSISGGGDSGGSGTQGLPRLTAGEITEALQAPLERSPSSVKAAQELDAAVQLFTNRALWEPGDLYRCCNHFKLHKAYKQAQAFDSIQHERMAEQVERELTRLVCEKYDAAWKFEMAKDWRNAKGAFEELMVILPIEELDKTGRIYKVIIKDNVLRHRNYIIKSKLGRVE